MLAKLTNNGKKEQRQINQLLTKSVTEDGTRGSQDIEARTTHKQHKLKAKRRRPGP